MQAAERVVQIKLELRCQVKDRRETGTLRVWLRVSGGVCMKTPSGIFCNISTWHSRNRTKPCEPNSEALVLFTNWRALEKWCSNRFHCESWANLEGIISAPSPAYRPWLFHRANTSLRLEDLLDSQNCDAGQGPRLTHSHEEDLNGDSGLSST